jgi:hypothetical protein
MGPELVSYDVEKVTNLEIPGIEPGPPGPYPVARLPRFVETLGFILVYTNSKSRVHRWLQREKF